MCKVMNAADYTAVNTSVENAILNDKKVLRVVKSEKIMLFDENTYAKEKNISFHNGVIELKLLSRLLPDAPDFARGFIGIVYRANESDTEFEAFYLRPTNGRDCYDPIRKKHGCQYFSYPGYTFRYFRDNNISGYEAECDIALNEWINLKAVIKDSKAEFYINDSLTPTLTVNDMKLGPDRRGSVGIFVDIGTEAFVSDLKVICKD